MKTKNILILATVSLFLLSTSCKKDKNKVTTPENPNEQELITTLKLTFVNNANAGDIVTAVFSDPDGDGGNAPTQHDNIVLSNNTTYTCTLLLLDESKTPTDTISKEVAEEKEVHQFFYTVTGANLTITYNDFDNNNVPVGLNTTASTGSAGTGTLKVVLKHQDGIKPTSGNGDSSLGDTDVEVDFNVTVN